MGVVCIHAGLPCSNSLRFCMPVFVALWAFHFECGLNRRDPGQHWPYVMHRFWRLLIPYTFWTLVYLILDHSLKELTTTPLHTMIGGWFGGYAWPGQYFFIIIFQLVWLLPLLRGWVDRKIVWIAIMAGVLVNAGAEYYLFRDSIIAKLGDRPFIYWLPYVFVGIVLGQGYPQPILSLLLPAVASLLVAPVELEHLAHFQQRVSPYLLPTVTVGSVMLLLALGPRFSNVPIAAPRRSGWLKKILLFIGQNSLVIFVANPLFLDAARRLDFGLIPTGLLSEFVSIGMAILGSLAIGQALRWLKMGILVGA